MKSTSPSSRTQHARAQVWVYGVLALVALGALGVSVADIAVSRVRQQRLGGEEYYPGWQHLIMTAVWAALLAPYACYR